MPPNGIVTSPPTLQSNAPLARLPGQLSCRRRHFIGTVSLGYEMWLFARCKMHTFFCRFCQSTVMVINFFVGRSRNQFDGSVVESLSVRPSLLVTPWALLNITHENPDSGPSLPPSLPPRQGQTKRKNALPLPLSLLIFPRPLGEERREERILLFV